MAKYKYDEDMEVFKRLDNRGNYLAVNVAEAQRIISLLDLGYNTNEIIGKMSLSNPRATSSTVRSFIRNYRDKNIEMPVDAPAPAKLFDKMTDSARIDALEERVCKLELIQKESALDKVKSWIRS